MAVGAGVNGGRARRGDVTPQAGGDLLQAPLCRGRRRLCGVNGGRWRGVSAGRTGRVGRQPTGAGGVNDGGVQPSMAVCAWVTVRPRGRAEAVRPG